MAIETAGPILLPVKMHVNIIPSLPKITSVYRAHRVEIPFRATPRPFSLHDSRLAVSVIDDIKIECAMAGFGRHSVRIFTPAEAEIHGKRKATPRRLWAVSRIGSLPQSVIALVVCSNLFPDGRKQTTLFLPVCFAQ